MRIIFIFILSFLFSNQTIEILSYDAHFKNIGAGSATLKTIATKSQTELVFSFKAKKMIDIFYKLREKIFIKINPQNHAIEYINKDSQQGKRIKKHEAVFDYLKMKVYSIEDTTDITTAVYNPISIISFLRNQQLELNQKFTFNVYSSGRIKPIEMIVVGKEDIMFNSQKNSCFILAPLYLNKNDAKDKKGDIKLWISESNNLPIIIEQHANFGEITLKLNHVRYEK